MNFQQLVDSYLLSEDPDYVDRGENVLGLEWPDKDALPFGYVNLLGQKTYAAFGDTVPVLQFNDFGPEWHNRLYVGDRIIQTHSKLVLKKVFPELVNTADRGVITFFANRGNNVMTTLDLSNTEDSEERQRKSNLLQLPSLDINPRDFLAPSGRIWTENKVVSFWSPEEDVQPFHVQRLMEYLKIPSETHGEYQLEFLGEDKPSRSVQDFLSGNKKEQPSLSPEEQAEKERRAKEALAKVHLAAGKGTVDKDVQDIIKQRKSAAAELDSKLRTQGKIPSLKTRQTAFTSEATEVYLKILEGRF